MVYYIEGQRYPGHGSERHSKDGEFIRTPTKFRNWITCNNNNNDNNINNDNDDADDDAKFPFVPGRYHLFSSHACPWSHSATLARNSRHLDSVVGISFAHPIRDDDYGWSLETQELGGGVGGVSAPGNALQKDVKYVSELYLKADPKYTGYITLPVLWDKQKETIVSNESLDIMAVFNEIKLPPQTQDDDDKNGGTNTAAHHGPIVDLFPSKEVHTMIQSFYNSLNNGVYRAGLAKSQDAYEEAVTNVFQKLDELDQLLDKQRYLMGGNTITAADIRLFVTLVRFDSVYYTLFKCNIRRIEDYTNLRNYVRDIYQLPGVADTVFLQEHIARHYYTSFTSANPRGVIPKSGYPNFHSFHNRSSHFGTSATTSSKQHGIAGANNTSPSTIAGEFKRPRSGLRNVISADGSTGYKAEPNRYHLFIANNCPWCHRVQLTRHILGLQDVIGADVLWYRRDAERGWQYHPSEPGCTDDTLNLGIEYVRELYERIGSSEKSVPVLWDKQTSTIVNNESAEIIRMMNTAFRDFATTRKLNLVPTHLENEIDRVNHFVYAEVNNGAYKAGFASTQKAYEFAHDNFFDALDILDKVLQFRKFLVSNDHVTEADVRLFPTLFRFDHVYYNRFLLRKKRLRDYPFLYSWLLRMMNDVPGVMEASNLDHCKRGYFGRTGNGLVPVGPAFMFEEPRAPGF